MAQEVRKGKTRRAQHLDTTRVALRGGEDLDRVLHGHVVLLLLLLLLLLLGRARLFGRVRAHGWPLGRLRGRLRSLLRCRLRSSGQSPAGRARLHGRVRAHAMLRGRLLGRLLGMLRGLVRRGLVWRGRALLGRLLIDLVLLDLVLVRCRGAVIRPCGGILISRLLLNILTILISRQFRHLRSALLESIAQS